MQVRCFPIRSICASYTLIALYTLCSFDEYPCVFGRVSGVSLCKVHVCADIGTACLIHVWAVGRVWILDVEISCLTIFSSNTLLTFIALQSLQSSFSLCASISLYLRPFVWSVGCRVFWCEVCILTDIKFVGSVCCRETSRTVSAISIGYMQVRCFPIRSICASYTLVAFITLCTFN